MITKAIIQSIDYSQNICRVRIPLLETASRNVNMIEANAQFSVVPGIYNSYKAGDVVFIGFEENKLEAPIILGKLFVSASNEASSYRGNLSGNSLSVTESAQLPYLTTFNYGKITQNEALYKDLNTPKKLADSIINLQQAQAPVQRYQTIIKISIDDVVYELYLKTADKFIYTVDGDMLSLNRLCVALKNSQLSNSFIPLDLAITTDLQSYPAALQIEEVTSASVKFKILINGTNYEVTEDNILEISSQVIYY